MDQTARREHSSLALPTRRPYLFGVLMVLLIVVVYVASGALATALEWPRLAIYGIANAALTIIGAGLVTALGWWGRIGFRAPERWSVLGLFWLPVVPVLVNASFGLAASLNAPQVVLFFGLALAVGFVEETFFRGLMLAPLVARGPGRAAVFTAVLFGLLHTMNLAAGSNSVYTLLQIGYAFAIGFCYAALVLRTGLIWPLVLTHFLTDFAGFLAGGGPGASTVTGGEIVISALYVVAFTGYGIWLLGGAGPGTNSPMTAYVPGVPQKPESPM